MRETSVRRFMIDEAMANAIPHRFSSVFSTTGRA
jgi:hypothetical protein